LKLKEPKPADPLKETIIKYIGKYKETQNHIPQTQKYKIKFKQNQVKTNRFPIKKEILFKLFVRQKAI
jgi:hypothetical protein